MKLRRMEIYDRKFEGTELIGMSSNKHKLTDVMMLHTQISYKDLGVGLFH
jgi:hypothetical protein